MATSIIDDWLLSSTIFHAFVKNVRKISNFSILLKIYKTQLLGLNK